MRALLDVSVLLALLDEEHASYPRAGRWLELQPELSWASCAITQNGYLRIVTQPSYPHPLAVGEAVEVLAETIAGTAHAYWPCDVSLLDTQVIDHTRLHGPRQLTDAYLLALAVAHGGSFVTLDRSVALSAVPGATDAHLVVI